MRIIPTAFPALTTMAGVFCLCGMQPGNAEEPIRFSGIHTIAVDASYAVPVGDRTDHMLRLIKSSGVNKSTGAIRFLDGATETEVVYGDDTKASGTKASGPHHGYISIPRLTERCSMSSTGIRQRSWLKGNFDLFPVGRGTL